MRRLRGAGLRGAAELLRGAGLHGAGLLALLLASLALASCGGGKSASTGSAGVAVAGGPAVSGAGEGAAGTTTTSGTQSTPSVSRGSGSGTRTNQGATTDNSGNGGRNQTHIKPPRTHGGSGKTVGGGGKTSGSSAPSSGTSTSSGGAAGGQAGGGAGESSYVVTSLNMEPTYPPRTTVKYNPTRTYPIVGDVVLFHLPLNALERGCGENPPPFHACQSSAPGLSATLAMGRVVGVPGDSLAFKEGNAILNGTLQRESSTKPCGEGPVCSFAQPIVVPADSYYILYDNRAMLDDSRVWGAVPQGAILGTITGTQ